MYTVKDILASDKPSVEEHVALDESKLKSECELDKCIDWIKQRSLKRVCVQFSQDQLSKAPQLVHILEEQLQEKLYILGDTSYGACCVDEVAAQHVNADGIIHFGHTCLSTSERIPVLYIFKKEQIDIDKFLNCFENSFSCEDRILLFYDVSYQHAIYALQQRLENFDKLIVSQLSTENNLPSHTAQTYFGRCFDTQGRNLNDYSIIFIGKDGPCVANFKYIFPEQPFFIYNPLFSVSFEQYEVNVSKFLRRRMFLIESLKNARNLGILIGTLCVKSYLKAVERIKCLSKPRGIKCYIISVGRINVAKLANFPEMDVYVLISCAENSLLDSKEFLQPIVTPYEVELAFNSAYKWSEKYVADFTTLLPGGANYIQENFDVDETKSNVSLISSNVQNTSIENDVLEGSSNSLVTKGLDTLALSESHGCNFLTSRSWVGLEQKLGQTAVEAATAGRSGLPFKYKNETE